MSYTCASCQVIFETGEQQREHYRSEWHRYNLRRKTGDLPPVTEAVFNQRLSGALSSTKKKEAEEVAAKQSRECLACRKVFASEKSFENHVRSKKHLEAAEQFGDAQVSKLVTKTEKAAAVKPMMGLLDGATESQVNDALKAHLEQAKTLAPEDCIFCSATSESFEENMKHMSAAHSLYIPDIEYVKDLRALTKYLGEKVSIGLCCLYCPSSIQPFSSLHSVRKHMQDKGHAKIRYDPAGQEELAEFYDFTESYPIVEDDGDEEYEDVDTDEEMDFLPQENAMVSPDGSELILPDGRSIGHRAYRIYYKQNLHNSMIRESRDRELVRQMIDDYAGKGQLVLSHLPTVKCKYDQKDFYDARKAGDLKQGLKQNGLMKHFRQQLLQ